MGGKDEGGRPAPLWILGNLGKGKWRRSVLGGVTAPDRLRQDRLVPLEDNEVRQTRGLRGELRVEPPAVLEGGGVTVTAGVLGDWASEEVIWPSRGL